MSGDCEICRGEGKIRLPIYRRSVAFVLGETPTLEHSHRTYPCPECGESIHQDHIAVVSRHLTVAAHDGGPDYDRHMREAAAHRLVSELLRGGFIRFERGKTDDREMTYPVRATLGVVAIHHVATLERRITQHQAAVAREVAAEAAHLINRWGSYYGDTTLHKAQAIDSLGAALTAVLARHPVPTT